MLRCARLIFGVSAALALGATPVITAAASSSPTYYAKITEGGTFAEDAKWDTTGPSTGEHDKGSGQFRVTASYSADVKVMLITGSITIVDIPNAHPTGSMSGTFHAEGTHTQDGDSNSSDHGTMDFAGPSGTTTGGTLDDFDPNGDNLSMQLGYQGTMLGKCQDDKFGDKCNENTAGPGVPEQLAGGNARPTLISDPKSPDAGGWTMHIAGGGTFIGARSHRYAGSSGPPLTCHGSLQSGWTCSFTGSKVWTKAPGVTYTTREQFSARITIVSKAK